MAKQKTWYNHTVYLKGTQLENLTPRGTIQNIIQLKTRQIALLGYKKVSK